MPTPTPMAGPTPTPASSPIEVCRLVPDDWASFRELRLEALRTEPDAFGASHAEALERGEDDWRGWIAVSATWQARRDGMPLGMVTLWLPPSEGVPEGEQMLPFLIQMFVTAQARGQGIGERLVEVALAQAREQGHRQVVLDVRAGNDAALRLYRRCGFRPVEQTVWHPTDLGSTSCELTMVCDLTAELGADPPAR